MERDNGTLERFFNHTLMKDLVMYRSDIGKMSNMINRKKGGGGKELIDMATKHVISKMKTPPEIKNMEKLTEKVNSFKEHIQSVIDKITGVSGSTDDIKWISDIRSKYDAFSHHIDQILETQGYRFVTENGMRMMMKDSREPEENNDTWSSLYNIWIPFITNIDQILESIEQEKNDQPVGDKAIKVFQVITEQLHTVMNIFDMFENLVDDLRKKYDEMSQRPVIKTYSLDSKKVPSVTESAIHYKHGSDQTGDVVFTKEKIYNFMRDVDLSQPDALSLIETQKMRIIDDYIQKINENSRFVEAIGLEMDDKKHTITPAILDKIKALEQFIGSVPAQAGGNGEIIAYNTSELYDLLLNMTDRIKLINIKLKDFKKIVRKHESEQKRIKYYIFYIMNTASLKGVKKLNIYNYINRGIMDFYRNILNDIDTRRSKDDMPIDAVYFDIYHGLMITRIKPFLIFLIDNMKIDSLIDIRKCTGPIVSDFVLFNHFKDILDSYYETIQNNVSIYARLNDFQSDTLPLELDQRLFIKDKSKPQNVIIDYKKCLKTITGKSRQDEFSKELWESIDRTEPQSSKFNMVFDYEEFNKNEDMAMYMSISTNISKKKSVMLITYGYSGTGKTYTLFGNGVDKGLLQSAIEGILSKKEIYFRTYEIYGAGVKYPFYWCDSVSEKCYVYRINPITYNIDTVYDTDVDKITSNTEIDSNSRSKSPAYTKIESQNVKGFFQNFDSLVDQIDVIRTANGRIKATPNNPVSSRSIIIYDMMIRVDDELVRLVVMDLPGREEIVQTYTKDYIEKPANRKFDTPFHKAVLSSMSIDPLYLSILCPVFIVKAFNNLDPDIRKYIMEQPISLEDLGDCLNKRNKCLPKFQLKSNRQIPHVAEHLNPEALEEKQELEEVVPVPVPVQTKTDFKNEIVLQMKHGDPKKMGQIIQIDEKNIIKLASNTTYVPDLEKISSNESISIDFGTVVWNNEKHVNKKWTTVQYQAVVAIHLLNRILLLKDAEIPSSDKRGQPKIYSKFDVLESIYRLIAENFGYNDYDKMFRSPFEGVYINENIVGVLKVLSTDKNMLNKNIDEAMKMISPQEDISFTDMKLRIRENNKKLYQPYNPDNGNLDKFEGCAIDKDVLNSIYEQNATSYSSQKIFLFCEPLIERVIKYYTTDTTIPITDERHDNIVQIKVGGSRDVKIFYLFSNVNQDTKCIHQYKLFENTSGLMKLIDSSNI